MAKKIDKDNIADEELLARGAGAGEQDEDEEEVDPEASEEEDTEEPDEEEEDDGGEDSDENNEAEEPAEEEDDAKSRGFRKSLEAQMRSEPSAKNAMEVSPFLNMLVKSMSKSIEELGEQMDSRMRKLEKGLRGVVENFDDLNPKVLAKSIRLEMDADFAELQALTKSLAGAVEDVGKMPMPAQTKKAVGTILQKSASPEELNLTYNEVGDLLQKSAQSGLINGNDIIAFELDKQGYVARNAEVIAQLNAKIKSAA